MLKTMTMVKITKQSNEALCIKTALKMVLLETTQQAIVSKRPGRLMHHTKCQYWRRQVSLPEERFAQVGHHIHKGKESCQA